MEQLLNTYKYKILITGSAGFIGSHLVERLIKEKVLIVGLDNINEYYDKNLKYARLQRHNIIKNIDDGENIKYNKLLTSKKYPNYKFIKLNLEDKINLMQLFLDEKFDIVCNLAAQAGVRYSVSNPDTYIQSNITGFMNILEVCKELNIKNLVYASSSSVYGLNKELPFSTSTKTDAPTNIYAVTKKTNELMAHTYSHLYNIKTTGLRFFSVYGPSSRPDMALHLFVKAAFEKKSIDIYNNANMLRDFTYIDDVVAMILLAIDKQYSQKNSSLKTLYKIYNIGNSKPVKLMDFITAIEHKLGFEISKNYLPLQDGDMINTSADMDETIKELEYTPATSIQDGIDKFVNWYIQFYKIKR